MRTSVRVMRLDWERPNDGLSRGFSADGRVLAQVAHVHSASGEEVGWLAWMTFEGELFDQFATMEAAQAAVEAALDRDSV